MSRRGTQRQSPSVTTPVSLAQQSAHARRGHQHKPRVPTYVEVRGQFVYPGDQVKSQVLPDVVMEPSPLVSLHYEVARYRCLAPSPGWQPALPALHALRTTRRARRRRSDEMIWLALVRPGAV